MVTGTCRAGAGSWGGTENTGIAAAGTTAGETGAGGPAGLGGSAGKAWPAGPGDGVRGGE